MYPLPDLIFRLLIDTTFSWLRMLIALALSMLIGLFVGIYAATNERAERVIIPVLDVLQTLPIVTFFPVVIFVIIFILPGYIGINTAVIFLVITSMLWDIVFGVYETVKALPKEFAEVAEIYKLDRWMTLKKIYIPASMPNVVGQSILSWSIGLFYLVTSEIFSTGNSLYTVKYGIGAALTNLAFGGNFLEYFLGLGIFILFVAATRIFFFERLDKIANRYNEQTTGKAEVIETRHRFRLLGMVKKFRLHIFKTERVGYENVRKKSITRLDIKRRHGGSAYAYIVKILIVLLILYAIFLYRQTITTYEYTVLQALFTSMVRIYLTYFVIIFIAVPISVYIIFISKHIERYSTLLQIIASIPATILLPVIAVVLHSYPMHDELVALSVFFLSGVWYVVFSIISHRSYIPGNLSEVKDIFGVKGAEAWRKIYLKAIIPGLITGSVTAVAAEWNASIVAEHFTTTAIGNGNVITSVGIGLGKLLDTALSSGNISLMALSLINLTIMIVLINKLIWKPIYKRSLGSYE